MADIAAEVGVGRRTLFRYFESKNDIPWGQFDRTLDGFRAILARDARRPPARRGRAARGARASTSSPPTPHPPHRERMRLILETPALQAHSVLRYAEWRAVIAEYVAGAPRPAARPTPCPAPSAASPWRSPSRRTRAGWPTPTATCRRCSTRRWRACATTSPDGRQRARGGDRVADREAGGVGLDEVVGVGAAALGRAGDLPAAEVGLERRGGAVGEDDVVEEDADALGGPVAGVGDRDLDALPGVRREVDAPLLPAARVAARRVPGAGGAGRRRTPTAPVWRLVVVELRVQGRASRRSSPRCSCRRCPAWCGRWRPAASSSRRRPGCAPRRTGGPRPPRCRTTSRRSSTRRRPGRRSPG